MRAASPALRSLAAHENFRRVIKRPELPALRGSVVKTTSFLAAPISTYGLKIFAALKCQDHMSFKSRMRRQYLHKILDAHVKIRMPAIQLRALRRSDATSTPLFVDDPVFTLKTGFSASSLERPLTHALK